MGLSGAIDELFSHVQGVTFHVQLWDQTIREYGRGKKPAFSIAFNTKEAAKRLLTQGSLGFGESYMDGSIEIDGDIEAYLRIRHQFRSIKPSPHLALTALWARRTTRSQRSEHIAYHYDLGNEFFGLFLDKKTMSYSAGLYDKSTKDLAQAQENKLELICDWLSLPTGASVLDLGSGWGGFAVHAALRHNWSVTGYTLSQQQLSYCNQLIKKHTLTKRITLHQQDMLDELPDEQYDAIVMIESIEHVGKLHLTEFITALYDRLRPGGVLYIQTTGRYEPRGVDRWTLTYVFPGGYLPSKPELLDAANSCGFEVIRCVDDTPSYIQTLSEWVTRLDTHEAVITEQYGMSFFRLWHLWMHGAKVAFEMNSMNLFRLEFRKPLSKDI